MDPELSYLIERGAQWIREQRALHRPDAQALEAQAMAMLGPFFGPDIMRDVRFKTVPVIRNPEFYREFEEAGRPVPMDFTDTHGITFEDTVLLSERYVAADGAPMSLLFHEMVHMVQYRLLGVGGFVRQYLTGWAENGFEYMAIPMERDAYELEERFAQNPHTPFPVRMEVSRRLGLSV